MFYLNAKLPGNYFPPPFSKHIPDAVSDPVLCPAAVFSPPLFLFSQGHRQQKELLAPAAVSQILWKRSRGRAQAELCASPDTHSQAPHQSSASAFIASLCYGGKTEKGRSGQSRWRTRRGGLGLLCAKPLHRSDKYDMFVIKKKKTFTITLSWPHTGWILGNFCRLRLNLSSVRPCRYYSI